LLVTQVLRLLLKELASQGLYLSNVKELASQGLYLSILLLNLPVMNLAL
jgi:hypothetical protein